MKVNAQLFNNTLAECVQRGSIQANGEDKWKVARSRGGSWATTTKKNVNWELV